MSIRVQTGNGVQATADGPRVEVAMVPATSPYAAVVKAATHRVGASFVPVDLASPADVAGRILVVDLTRVMVAQRLGRRVVAISPRNDLDCYDIVRPDEVDLRMERSLRNLVEIERLRSRVKEERETVQILNEIGFALSAMTDTHDLLQRILTHARRALRADGGSIYLLQGDVLHFGASQNDTVNFKPSRELLKVDDSSLAGFVANRGQLLKIDDIDRIPNNAPYKPNYTNDKALGYRTRSALLVPMLDRDSTVTGVLAVYNRKTIPGIPLASFDRVLPFTERDADLARSIASQAAVAMENHRLYSDIRNLFHGFVNAAVTVIEARDPSTAGHSHRVATLTVNMARAVHASSDKPFHHHRFSNQDIEELSYASLLHDFGKVGVPERVLLKADKLYPWELEAIEGRFKLAGMHANLECLRKAFDEDGLAEKLAVLDEDLGFVRAVNKPSFRFSQQDADRLQAIAARWYVDVLDQPVLVDDDIRRLCIPRGSLDAQERRAIEMHVVHTYNFLKVIPWTRQLRRVPELAHAHHEKLDGTGYPLGLSQDEIPYGARLMTIADIFDALVAGDRPYKPAMTIDRARSILLEEADAGRVEKPAVELFFTKELWEGVILPRVDWVMLLLLACLRAPPLPETEPVCNPQPPCEGAEPMLHTDGSESGWVRCADRSINRETVKEIPVGYYGWTCEDKGPSDYAEYDECAANADCEAGQFCAFDIYEPGGGSFCYCAPEPCRSDAECDGACYFGKCIAQSCHTNADCESGECGLWDQYWGGSDVYGTDYGTTCRTPEDECRSGDGDACWCGKDFACFDGEAC